MILLPAWNGSVGRVAGAVVYQLLKSVGHSTMALAEVVGPYVDNADDKSWRGSMLAYRSRMQSGRRLD